MGEQAKIDDMIAALEIALAIADERGLIDVGIHVDQALIAAKGEKTAATHFTARA